MLWIYARFDLMSKSSNLCENLQIYQYQYVSLSHVIKWEREWGGKKEKERQRQRVSEEWEREGGETNKISYRDK